MKKVALNASLVFAVLGSQTAPALEIPTSAQQDNRIRFVNYQPYNVTRIVGTIRSSVQIEFAVDEEIAHVALGNSVAWEVAPAGNILFLKPRENQPATNISVVTRRRDGARRSYQLELIVREGPVNAGENTYFYVKYRYPGDEAVRRKLAEEARKRTAQAGYVNQVLEMHEQYGPRNWRYSAQGAGAIEPEVVYDNGKVTTLVFAGNQEMPAIYIENSDGTESLVPKSVQGEMVMVHAIARKLILRRGSDTLCIFNEAYSPVGIKPGTNTTSPSVERTISVRAPAE